MQNTVIGGERAIRASLALLERQKRGDADVAKIEPDQILQQLGRAIDRVTSEAGYLDRTMAARAIHQAQGDLAEATTLLRAFKSTLPCFGIAEPFDTDRIAIRRRIATTHKDIAGGQFLGATYDYTHRLLGTGTAVDLDDGDLLDVAPPARDPVLGSAFASEELQPLLIAPSSHEPAAACQAERASRLASLALADEGTLTSVANAAMQDMGTNHPLVADLRVGEVGVALRIEDLGLAVDLADILVTECQTIHETIDGAGRHDPGFTLGYGLCFGQSERKAITMALAERWLRWDEFGEPPSSVGQDAAFVLRHADPVIGAGQVQHLKLPHYVDFQAQIQTLKAMRDGSNR
ncbi:carbon-phosphorus lyase complex subunit PhnI [Labrys wisconsinensis]|uniref:Alpha-D-ribose 1-methylphosphonate 5-triphosphate synthase subunit PhnI n=1 Tax=Labrys wisconsinensis TaxID=425677 RepID=A0ABU0JIR7_9HYPH|nr:carbon-phosphorus lyase complex subunit PhnI [Labrys wisconsinensis]MDQ0473308.1 alpha-D-ribose 1-methylphosphonate 5-triphosphate synthase subunit PhnI [Labrys wisconsinensis]